MYGSVNENPFHPVCRLYFFIATQKFVTVGETRGDQVQITKGIEKGDRVVTAGQLKIKNGSIVMIDNTAAPSNNPAPHPQNE